MAHRSYRKGSRDTDWGTWESGETLRIDQINCGSLLRIADATEKVAGNYTALQDHVKYLEGRVDELAREKDSLRRCLAATRGVVTKLKKRK